jgi:LPXTG-motif cell wall-anchored protein
MRAKSLRVILMAVVVIVALVIAVVPSFAQSGTTSSSKTGVNNWQTLGVGQSVEYRLQYKGGSGGVTVMVGAMPANSLNFKVYTDQAWLTGGDPVGQGTVQNKSSSNGTATPSPLNGGALVWQTNDPAGQLFHIQINNTSAAPTQYWIDATGGGNGGLYPYSAAATSSTTTTTTGTTASAGTGTTATAPKTLPVTGSEDANLPVYFMAGMALIGAGWLATRKAMQR